MVKKASKKTKKYYYVERTNRNDNSIESWTVKAESGHAAFKKLSPWGSGWKKGYKATLIRKKKK
jgi:hypothetical protein